MALLVHSHKGRAWPTLRVAQTGSCCSGGCSLRWRASPTLARVVVMPSHPASLRTYLI